MERPTTFGNGYREIGRRCTGGRKFGTSQGRGSKGDVIKGDWDGKATTEDKKKIKKDSFEFAGKKTQKPLSYFEVPHEPNHIFSKQHEYGQIGDCV